jgi:hypothetical protein
MLFRIDTLLHLLHLLHPLHLNTPVHIDAPLHIDTPLHIDALLHLLHIDTLLRLFTLELISRCTIGGPAFSGICMFASEKGHCPRGHACYAPCILRRPPTPSFYSVSPCNVMRRVPQRLRSFWFCLYPAPGFVCFICSGALCRARSACAGVTVPFWCKRPRTRRIERLNRKGPEYSGPFSVMLLLCLVSL